VFSIKYNAKTITTTLRNNLITMLRNNLITTLCYNFITTWFNNNFVGGFLIII